MPSVPSASMAQQAGDGTSVIGLKLWGMIYHDSSGRGRVLQGNESCTKNFRNILLLTSASF